MGSEDRGCCDKCAKMFIMVINIIIILIGGAILAAGLYWQLNETGFYKEIFNHDIFNIPIVSIVVGALLLLVGICGFFGACCEVMFLLKVYMGFLILIMLVEIILAVGCVAMKSEVEEYATNKTYEFIGYYGDEAKDEADIIKKTVDAIQENFECCGVTGPDDWPNYNAAYKSETAPERTVPDSCCKDPDSAGCGSAKTISANENIYKIGCKVSMINFVENNLLYVGIVSGVIVILQMCVILCIGHLKTRLEDDIAFEYYTPLDES
ncbi:hypothetical protein ACHWQZ_G001418 [Mnemiopsis leidyi]